VEAWYVEADMELGPAFRLLAGVRNEQSIQQVTTFDLFNANADPLVAELESDDFFPVLTGTWIIDSLGMQVRLGYSETISRPDFRELSEAPFIHPVTGLEIIGNPDLQVAYIQNYDARWEWYFSADESISVGLFHKDFETPIEAIIKPGIDNRRTFINAEGGTVSGIEIDAFRWLDFVNDDLENWFTAVNLTLIDSEVDIRPEDAGILTESNRRLQGQADYIFNLQVGYDDSFNNKGALVYHITGERIREAGVLGAPDVMDQPYGELDFNFIHTFSDNLSMSFKARNLLNNLRETTQGGLDANSYKEGRAYSLGMNYTF
jgi:TonB-dependent receptor